MGIFKQGQFFKTHEDITKVDSVFGVAINSKKAVLFTSRGRSGWKITNGPIPPNVILVSNPTEQFSRYELKVSFAAALSALGIEHPFKTD